MATSSPNPGGANGGGGGGNLAELIGPAEAPAAWTSGGGGGVGGQTIPHWYSPKQRADGGFGGGGAGTGVDNYGGNGGFGGGGGAAPYAMENYDASFGGNGGFGGGGGLGLEGAEITPGTAGAGGFGAGEGYLITGTAELPLGYNVSGGGGLGAGGAVFVMGGAGLTIVNGSFNGNTVANGTGFVNGSAYGPDAFLGGNITFQVDSGKTVTLGNLGGAGNSTDPNVTNHLNDPNAQGGLTKTGAGTLELTGNNTYTGATTVGAGRLVVNGSITSNVTAQSGATIGGTGRIGGLILESGSRLSPGNSPGALSVDGNATWSGGASYNWQVYAANTDPAVQAGAGTDWDFLDVSGTLTLGLDPANRFNLNLWSLSGTNPDTNGTIPGWDPTVGSTWLIASAGSGIYSNGTALTPNTDYTSLFNINTAATNGTGGWIGALPGGFQVVTLGSANNLYLYALPGSAAVPEPGQVAASILLLCGIGGYVWLKRRNPKPSA